MKIFFSIVLLLIFNPIFSQVFITLDEDTAEFISDVNFVAYKNHKPVYRGITLNDKVTSVDSDFDSISFSKPEYKSAGFLKQQLDTIVYLKKNIITLDEIVITRSKKNQIVIGEKNRFVKSRAYGFSSELLDEGVVLRNKTNTNLTINKVIFFVNKVKIATRYKVNFFKIQESLPLHGNQYISNEALVFTTDTLLLKPGIKGEVKIDIVPVYSLPTGDEIFVSIQLIDYLDDRGIPIKPDSENDRWTKLKFQLSDNADYYAKFINSHTRELSTNMKNVNLQINYDFAHRFFKKPHKSIIVAPAILLYAEKAE